MEKDQGEVIKYIHKYRDEVTNEMKYFLAKAKTGGRQKSNSSYIHFKQKEIDIDWIYELCKDQGSEEWYYELVSIENMNSTHESPIASMRKIMDVKNNPKRLGNVPSIQFIPG